ncbi:LysR substrate-binding domain-containing protein [Roseovarius sp.]|jgi:DNA-binding transcriptional LysR family regulator|nr:LysR substrate-binding domain-containing protein [Roseovarius sp.]MAZ22805.1 transcriptional regulator [Roseovarius sp.]
MARLSHLLQSPRALIIFEAAARLRSFTRAGEELHMQQPSVSAAIKGLEAGLGVQLFLRGHRQVDLTAAGARLYSDVTKALHDMENSISAVRQMGQQSHVTISTSSAFSYYWMMPRLHLLRARHPEIDLRMQNSDREPELASENLSLGIRLGDGNYPGYETAKIADEIIYPVASPRVMAAAKNLRSIPTLMSERLIHLEEPIRQRPNWSDWFAHHGIRDRDVSAGLRLNDYALVLQAAVSGEGFAFGWEHIVRNLLDRGMLAARREWSWRTGQGIYLLWSSHAPLSDHAIAVRDWIIDVAREGPEAEAARVPAPDLTR